MTPFHRAHDFLFTFHLVMPNILSCFQDMES